MALQNNTDVFLGRALGVGIKCRVDRERCLFRREMWWGGVSLAVATAPASNGEPTVEYKNQPRQRFDVFVPHPGRLPLLMSKRSPIHEVQRGTITSRVRHSPKKAG